MNPTPKTLVATAALFTALLLSACVRSRMEAYADPGRRPARFARIAVEFVEPDLIRKRRSERAFAAALAGEMPGTEVVASLDLFRPTARHSRGEVLDELERQGFDGYLLIDLRERYIDPSAEGVVLLFDEPLALALGGSHEFLGYGLDLLDVPGRDRVWTATCHLTRNQLASFKRVMRALARRTGQGLRNARLAL